MAPCHKRSFLALEFCITSILTVFGVTAAHHRGVAQNLWRRMQ